MDDWDTWYARSVADTEDDEPEDEAELDDEG
jgi:hypothetical protein